MVEDHDAGAGGSEDRDAGLIGFPPDAADSGRWAAGRDLSWRVLDDELAVYADRQAATHLLDADAGTVLLLLLDAEQPLSRLELKQRQPDMAPQRLDEVLSELQRVELVEVVR